MSEIEDREEDGREQRPQSRLEREILAGELSNEEIARQVGGLTAAQSGLQKKINQLEQAGQGTTEQRLAIREALLDRAAERGIAPQIARLFKADSLEDVDAVLDRYQSVTDDQKAADARAYDRANGRTVTSHREEAGSPIDGLSLAELQNLSPRYIERHLNKSASGESRADRVERSIKGVL